MGDPHLKPIIEFITKNNPNLERDDNYKNIEWHVPNASSVKEYAYTEDKGMFRPKMEDYHCHMDKFNGNDDCGVFAVFDGHGGKQVSKKLSEKFCS